MAGIVEKLSDLVFGRTTKAARKLALLAEREALGQHKPTEDDAQELSRALQEAGKTIVDFNAMVALFKKRQALAARVGDIAKKEADAIAAGRARDAHVAQHQKFWEERLKREAELTDASLKADHALNMARKAQGELNSLQILHRDEFGLSDIDLSGFTLVAEGAIAGPSDPKAPLYYCTNEVAEAEAERRQKLVDAKRAEALALYNTAHADWENRFTWLDGTIRRLRANAPASPSMASVIWRNGEAVLS